MTEDPLLEFVDDSVEEEWLWSRSSRVTVETHKLPFETHPCDMILLHRTSGPEQNSQKRICRRLDTRANREHREERQTFIIL